MKPDMEIEFVPAESHTTVIQGEAIRRSPPYEGKR
jgi:hypothetical protein